MEAMRKMARRGPEPQPGLGEAIKVLRERRGIQQKVLAQRAELHRSWIYKIESGKVDPTWGDMRRIARGLGVELRELAEEAEEREPRPSRCRTKRRK